MSYTTLQADIATYSHRSDLTSVLPTMIANAEAMLFRSLGGVEFETSVTGVTASNTIALPTDFLNVSRLVINNATLDYHNGRVDDLATLTATPGFFTIDADQIIILPPVEDGTAYTLLYNAKLTPLSGVATTNWLLENASDLYLWASLAEVGKYIRDTDLVTLANATMGPMLESVISTCRRRKYPDRGGLQIKPRRA